MPLPHANWNYPTAIRFGVGRVRELPQLCGELEIRRPLLVTDPALAALPIVGDVIADAEAAGTPITLFADIRSNPVGSDIEAGVAVYRGGRHDGVIAFGGGSALDCGKVIAFMSGQSRSLWDFEDIGDWWTRADPHGIAPVIAVPTTAGTGSEVGRAGVILDEAAHVKRIIFHPKMMPTAVISDPELTVGLPPAITAATGMDALSHCVEAFCARGFHPMADGVALEGMRLIKEWLPRAYRDGTDLEARGHMLVAASMGATAFQKGLGGMHALSHPIGALCGTHHGLTNAVLMPYILQFNQAAIDDRLSQVAAYLGLGSSFRSVLDWTLELRRELGIPNSLSGLGVTPELFPELAAMAEVDPSAAGNPVKFDATAAMRILAVSCDGT
jgi:alcohol dehydrogenase class IV